MNPNPGDAGQDGSPERAEHTSRLKQFWEKNKRSWKQSWRQTSNWNKLLVMLTAVIALSNAFYTHYARKQFSTMHDQLEEMRSRLLKPRRTTLALLPHKEKLPKLRWKLRNKISATRPKPLTTSSV